MGKRLIEADIQTRTSRRKLQPGLYWRAIVEGVHLGYRRSQSGGGEWLVRWRHGVGYRRAAVGTADDEISAGTLDFNRAVAAAKGVVEAVRLELAAQASGPVATVETAVKNYIATRDARETRREGRPKKSDAARRLCRHVIGRDQLGKRAAIPAAPLAKVELHRLSEGDLIKWRNSLSADMKATTRQRLINDLKAALNAECTARRSSLPPGLPAVIKHGLRSLGDEHDAEPVARENQILTDEQVARIVKAAEKVDAAGGFGGDLFRFVLVLAATGARFSQVARIQVGDVQPENGRLMVPSSRKGKGRKQSLVPVPVGEDVLQALEPVTRGRAKHAPLLERWRSVQVPGGGWRPETRGPWLNSSELQKPWDLIRAEAELPGVIPYALRHSAIVRGIRANLPIRLVAAIHDTSTAMIERHYSRWIASGLDELARAAIVPLHPGHMQSN